jgi:hypothetical protein
VRGEIGIHGVVDKLDTRGLGSWVRLTYWGVGPGRELGLPHSAIILTASLSLLLSVRFFCLELFPHEVHGFHHVSSMGRVLE